MAAKGRRVSTPDDAKVTLLLTALRGGNYIEVACLYAGLAPSTVYRWMERGRNEKQRQESGAKPDPKEVPYIDLCESVEKARADAVVRNVTIIQQAAQTGTWQAAAWWLERSMPQQFGRRIQAEVTQKPSVEDLEARMLILLGEDEDDLSETDS